MFTDREKTKVKHTIRRREQLSSIQNTLSFMERVGKRPRWQLSTCRVQDGFHILLSIQTKNVVQPINKQNCPIIPNSIGPVT